MVSYSCETCFYSRPGSDADSAWDFLECRRNPPLVVPKAAKDTDTNFGSFLRYATCWPVVLKDHWCGEYRAANPEMPKWLNPPTPDGQG